MDRNKKQNTQPSSSDRTPKPLQSICSTLPSINIKRLNLYSATSLQVTNNALSNDKIFSNKARVIVSPLRSNVLKSLKNSNVFKLDDGFRPQVSMCNARRCICCPLFQTNSNISSSVNNRTFNCLFDSNLS